MQARSVQQPWDWIVFEASKDLRFLDFCTLFFTAMKFGIRKLFVHLHWLEIQFNRTCVFSVTCPLPVTIPVTVNRWSFRCTMPEIDFKLVETESWLKIWAGNYQNAMIKQWHKTILISIISYCLCLCKKINRVSVFADITSIFNPL